jgi:tetratricopeptide (TPR) repeat protein
MDRTSRTDWTGRPDRAGRPTTGRGEDRTWRSERPATRPGGEDRYSSAAGRSGDRRAPARTGTARKTTGRAPRVEEDYESTRGSRPTRGAEIAIPSGADPKLLDPSVRSELRSLSKLAAEFVGAHLVAAGQLIDTDPAKALEHARAARGRGARVAAVREATGLAAYHAGEWAEALSELRAARRISGDPSHLAVMADCERALGRPARALKTLDDPVVGKLDAAARAELLIVVAGARRDLNQLDAALAVFERSGFLDVKNPKPGSARLWYAYADALAEAGRVEDAVQWFGAAAQADFDDETDAADRAADLL